MKLIRPELNRTGHLESRLHDLLFNDESYWDLFPTKLKTRLSGEYPGIRTDVYESPNGYHCVLELPAVQKEDLKVEVDHSVVTVSGKVPRLDAADDQFVEFSRSYNIPDSADSEQIEAELKDGLLLLTMPKVETRKVKSIEIK